MNSNSLVIKQKQNMYMKTEFQNTIARLSFLCHIINRHQNYLDKCLTVGIKTKNLPRTTKFKFGCLVKFFIRQPHVQDDHFKVVPRVVFLYRFDCIYIALLGICLSTQTIFLFCYIFERSCFNCTCMNVSCWLKY